MNPTLQEIIQNYKSFQRYDNEDLYLYEDSNKVLRCSLTIDGFKKDVQKIYENNLYVLNAVKTINNKWF